MYSGPACRCCRGLQWLQPLAVPRLSSQLPPEARLRLALLQPEVLDIQRRVDRIRRFRRRRVHHQRGGLTLSLGPLTISAISLQYKEQGGFSADIHYA